MVKKRILHHMGEAINKYKLIEDGDNILVGLSGGKDSWVLLDLLLDLKKRAPINFDVTAIIIDANFGMDYSKAIEYLKKKQIPYHHKKTEIKKIIESNPPKNPCFMCSRLRRGILYDFAKNNKFNKLALGHHLDDAMETLLLNIFYISKLTALKPKVFAQDNINIVIRPLIEVKENDIAKYAKEKKFPIVPENCMFKYKSSKRAMIKDMLNNMSKDNNYLYPSMKNIMQELYTLKK